MDSTAEEVMVEVTATRWSSGQRIDRPLCAVRDDHDGLKSGTSAKVGDWNDALING